MDHAWRIQYARPSFIKDERGNWGRARFSHLISSVPSHRHPFWTKQDMHFWYTITYQSKKGKKNFFVLNPIWSPLSLLCFLPINFSFILYTFPLYQASRHWVISSLFSCIKENTFMVYHLVNLQQKIIMSQLNLLLSRLLDQRNSPF